MIYTFYSFKGGVGRSMSLANVAACFQRAGARVVVVDWDLEAPGVESYFVSDAAELDEIRSTIGLVDVLSSYRRTYPTLEFPVPDASASVQDRVDGDVAALERQLPPLAPALYPLRRSGNSSVLLLHAGWRAGPRFRTYAETVQSFDWTEFYSSYRGEAYFEWMRRQLLSEDLADVVMIDSRTGVTEMGGVCTRQLADVVVCFSVMNQQNLQGSLQMAASFLRSDLTERRGRSLQTVFVPARVDSFNTTLKNELQKEFDERFARYTPAALRAVGASFWDLRIPYISDYAYRERLAVGDPEADKDLEEAYRRIAAHLAMLAPRSSQLRTLSASEIQRVFGWQLPDAVVIYEGHELATPALELVNQLKEAPVSIWPEPLQVRSGATAELHSTISQARVVVALGRAGTLTSGWLRAVWRAARERGLGIIPVHLGEGGAVAGSSSPDWLWRTPVVHLPRQWPELVERLRQPRVPPRLLAMAPPLASRHVARRNETEALVAALLEGKKKPSAQTVVLWGLVGAGKTTLVAAACRDERVQDAFPDGVSWISLATPGADVPSELRRCLSACGRRLSAEFPEAELRRELQLQLESRRCLVVLDEARDIEQVRSLLLAAPGSAHVVTTRFRRLAYAFDGPALVVEGLAPDDARSLLMLRVAPEASSDPETKTLVDALISKVGSSAVALNRISYELSRRMDLEQPLPEALRELSESIDAQGIGALEQDSDTLGTESIYGSLDATLARLSGEDRALLTTVAERAGTDGARLSEIAGLLRESPKKLRDWMEQMTDHAFLRFDRTIGTVVVHPLVRLFLEAESRTRLRPGGEELHEPPGLEVAGPARDEHSHGSLDGTVSGESRPPEGRVRRARRWVLPMLAAASMVAALPFICSAPSSPQTAATKSVEDAALAGPPKAGMRPPHEPSPAAPAPSDGTDSSEASATAARLAEEQLRVAGWTQAMGDYHSALEQYRQAAALNPADASAWLGQANAALALGQSDRAIQSFGKVLELATPRADGPPGVSLDQRVMAHLGLATALGERAALGVTGDIDLDHADGARALAEIEKALGLNPRSAAAAHASGSLLERGGRQLAAIESYSRAVEIDPELAEAYFQRGRVYQRLAEAKAGGEERRLAAADFRTVLSLARAEPRTARAARARLAQLGERAQAPEPVTVYLQYANRSDAAVLSKVRGALSRTGVSAPSPELMQAPIRVANLYYYFPDDEGEARLVKAAVEAALAVEGIDLNVPTQYRSIERFPSAKPRRLELWLPPLGTPGVQALAAARRSMKR